MIDNRLPLRDCVRPPVNVLFVGINPGLRSAAVGHHFAGYSNRFWKLLSESKLVPEPIGFRDDRRLPEFGFGITNLIARPTPGVHLLAPAEYAAGVATLRRKVRRWKPRIVAAVGVTVFRALSGVRSGSVRLGAAPGLFEGARLFVLPNPSGRNANYSYAEMLEAFVALKAFARGRQRGLPPVLGSGGGTRDA
jgi:TDG/mug DNA glycosylase family protein